MKRIVRFGMLLAIFFGMVGFALPAAASTPNNYIVTVGSENVSLGVSLMAYFPSTVMIHVGDSITWVVNSHEIHTVTFLAGQPLENFVINAPQGMPSPAEINPVAAFPTPTNGYYDGSAYMNSGLMSTDPGFVKTYTLTFTQQGVFDYVCYVHGQTMSGQIDVVADNVAVPTPAQVRTQGQAEMRATWLKVPPVLAKARAQVVPPTRNADGTLTHTITLGYMSGQIMIMRFFPSSMTVHPGDTIVWKLSPNNGDAPHTVTFFNGAPDLPLVTVVQGQDGPIPLINPAVVYPSQAVMQGVPLNNTDFFNSGLLVPGMNESFSIKVGNINGELYYECILHDSSGMSARLFVAPH
jgi:plastocyanin